MREKYESLSVTVLREVAKARGLRHLSGLKKRELVELMLQEDEKVTGGEQEGQPEGKQTQPAESRSVQPAESGGEERDVQNSEEERKVQPAENGREERKVQAAESGREERKAQAAESGREERKVQAAESGREERKVQAAESGREERKVQAAESGREERKVQPAESGRGERRTQLPESGREERKVLSAEGGKEERKAQPADSRREEQRMQSPEDRREERRIQNSERKPNRIITSDGIEIDNPELDSGISAHGILEVMPDGYGFIRCENYLPGDHDVYVSPSQIRKFGLKTGDIIHGNTRVKTQQEKFSALLYIKSINGNHPSEILKRPNFEDLTPIFPNERIRLETDRTAVAMRIMDIVSPIGKGQRGMIVSQPKAGKTTLLKQVAKAVTRNNPRMHLIILLIDERPEEVTDIKEAIEGKNVEVIYSTFDELPEHHKRVSEMVIERARRLVEHGKDVMILLDSITRLARAYNLIVPPSGRTLSGGIDPAALHMPKRFFGAARNMREGGSITILATALVDTGSRMDDVIYEEFKGTGNMELILDRKLSERRIFPAVDITGSGTRREDLLLNREEQEAVEIMRRAINGMKTDEAVESILNLFVRTNSNREFCQMIKKTKLS
ncbi:MAG: transcription termination factor Rho [Lachnospiraceae bacterium]|nr:transcription termination factor Rho [Lachnospiraceae bacterium]